MISVEPEAALKAISTSKLPDGTDFKPLQIALVEKPLALSSQLSDSNAWATVEVVSGNYMQVRTSSKIANFLVTSDVYYPGWRARVDGQETPLYRANYALRGVLVPPGDHVVLFEYRPRSFKVGAVISLLSLLAIGAISLGYFRGRAKQKRRSN